MRNAAKEEHNQTGGSAETGTVVNSPDRHRKWLCRGISLLLPMLTMAVGAGLGYVKWQSDSIRAAQTAGEHALTTATQTTVTMLSYRPDRVEEDLTSARGLLSGDFLDEYTSLINEVVIPGARDKQITATATVPSAAVVSSTADHAVVLVYINQTTTVGSGQPTFSASTARVALDRYDDRWLVSAFSPL